MTSNFEGLEYEESTENLDLTIESTTERLELLSAYIDGELSAVERNQVQIWLDEDPQFKQLYSQLLALQGQIQHSVAPPSEKSVSEITAGVFRAVDRKRRQRKLFWGGSALAASILAAVAGLIPGTAPLRMATRENPAEIESKTVMLAVAVNKPAIDIPKALDGYDAERAVENF